MVALDGMWCDAMWCDNIILILQDEPVKYYTKYMSKPPLFSSETERQSRQQKPQAAPSYRELIEIQKKKTTERDDRHGL